ncbi:MAG: adenylyl-sulfate kinase [Cyclobacteriaceae bacterium]|nr:adenylyl-sulfate kinase [Cyclobacteriaceae bacterium]
MQNNLHTQLTKVTKNDREKLLNQNAQLIWFTGLSGSGKSTLAIVLEKKLFDKGFKTYLLDGDNVRQGLNKDLSFDDTGRIENIRRIGEVANLMLEAGTIVLSAFISPFASDRELVKQTVGEAAFMEIFVDCPLEECEQRDVKGLYQKAREGAIKNFTGIDSPYEKPSHPDLIIKTDELSLEESLDLLLKQVLPRISKK